MSASLHFLRLEYAMENLRESKEFFARTVIPYDKTSRIPQKFVLLVSSDQLVCDTQS